MNWADKFLVDWVCAAIAIPLLDAAVTGAFWFKFRIIGTVNSPRVRIAFFLISMALLVFIFVDLRHKLPH